MINIFFALALQLFAEPNTSNSPNAAFVQSQAQFKEIAVLTSSDTSQYGIGSALQQALGNLFQQTQSFNVQIVNQTLPSFTSTEINKLYPAFKTNYLSFAYIEQERITLFLFDSGHPKEFISTTQGLVDPMLGNEVNAQVIEYKFRVCFNQLLSLFYQGQFQPLPSNQAPSISENETDDPIKRAEISRRLFRELASLSDSKYYIGASLGMSRFSGGPSSASSVNFGGILGYLLTERINAELVFDIFSYFMASGSLKYRFILSDRYLSLYGSMNAGQVMGTIVGPRAGFDEAFLLPGQMLFGPGFTFDIPLLGAVLRGDIRLFFGGGLVLLGNYGLVYNF